MEFITIFLKMGHGNQFPFLQIPAVDNQGFADELVWRKLIQCGTSGKNMGGRIHMGTGVGEQCNSAFFEEVGFIGAGSFQPGCFCAGIDGHIFPDDMGQIHNSHGASFFPVENGAADAAP